MKISHFILILVLCLSSCKKQQKDTLKTSLNTSEATEVKNKNIAQQNKYPTLFNRAPNDCSFVSTQILTDALQVSDGTVKLGYNDCNYILTETNGKVTRFNFIVVSWGSNKISNEIKTAQKNAENFGENSTLSQYRISETGDTYLSMHQNRMIRILNKNYNNAIIINYNAQVDPAEEDAEKRKMLKEEALERAYIISNYLLKKHQIT